MKKTYNVEIAVKIPFPKTFKYRVQASNAERAIHYSWDFFKKETKGKRITSWTVSVDVLSMHYNDMLSTTKPLPFP